MVQSYKINCKYEKDEHYIFAEIVEENTSKYFFIQNNFATFANVILNTIFLP